MVEKRVEDLTKRELLELLWIKEKEVPTIKVSFPSALLPIYQKFRSKKQEHFFVTTLNGAHEVIKTRVITKGLVNQTVVHPREIFSNAIKDNATCIIIGHNHPSGNLTPSDEDIAITKRLKDSGEILGIRVLDHIIVSRKGYYSFLEDNKF